MTVTYHRELVQGSEEWLQARCGLLTASEVDRIITPKLKIAENAKTRAHLWELAAQRISQHVEPTYISDAMLRGHEDEQLARELYAKHYAPVDQIGFVTNSKWGFTLGCSPDGLVGDEGKIECKSRCQKYQVQTIVEEWTGVARIPEEYWLQVQTGLLVTGRKWCDFISYSGGLPMVVSRVEADAKTQDAIIDAASKFEARINEVVADFHAAVEARGYRPTERRIEQEMFV
jgi:predicted phage-related endonuclease